MLGLQTGLQRIVGSHALRGVCAFRPPSVMLSSASRTVPAGSSRFQQRQVGGAGRDLGVLS